MDKPILTVTLNPAIDLTITCDTLSLDAVNIATSGSHRAAGKGINVAKVLSDLGFDVNTSGIFGKNNRGQFDTFFYHQPIEDHGYYIAGDTRTNIKIRDNQERITEINLPGLPIEPAQLNSFRDYLLDIADESDWVVLAGSLPPTLPADFYRNLIDDLNNLDKHVILDTSGLPLCEAVTAKPFLIKPNRMELGQISGTPVTNQQQEWQVVQQLLAMGITHVVVSDGSEGARWYNQQECWQARPPKVTVASTVGAGDSMVSGLVRGLALGWSIEKTLQLATGIAALSVTQIGVGIADPQELATLLEKVTVEPLAAGGQ